MTEAIEDKRFERLVQRFDPQSKLLRAWELKGGISAQVTALEIEPADGQTKKMIVRQHGDVDRKQNPHIAADEFKLLQILHATGLATPQPYYVDESGEIFPTPYMVIEYIEGATDFTPVNLSDAVVQLTTHLVRIHHVGQSKLSFLPQQAEICAEKIRARPAKLDESLREGRIRDVLESAWPLTQRNPSVLLHGDFWPGNILWRAGQLVAVIDWEDAQTGDPLADFANSRLEILWAFGLDAMRQFTQQYQSMTTLNFTNLPCWDLYAALRPAFKIGEWAADEAAEKRMRDSHRLFITQAFEKLGVG